MFALMRRIVWSDRVLTPDELSALRGAAEALSVRGVGALMSKGERHTAPAVPSRPEARDLAILAAAWIACVDGAFQPEELELLSEFAERGGMQETRARALMQQAAGALDHRTADRASMTATAWRQELEALMKALAEPPRD